MARSTYAQLAHCIVLVSIRAIIDSGAFPIRERRWIAVRATELTSQLMTFAKGAAPVKSAKTIDELINEIAELTLHGSNTKPYYQFAKNLRPVDIDAGQIGQVLQNLIINADQAMPKGGLLKISGQNIEVTADHSLPLNPGEYVKITITDTGTGMSEEVQKRVFDPYFTTKSSGHGLGLSITYRIIERHGGHIRFESELGAGTTFIFYQPASEKTLVSKTEQADLLQFGKGKILLMDDQESVHTTMTAMLAKLGYEVESVYDGRQWRIMEKH